MPRNILFEVSLIDPSTGLTIPVRMSAVHADAKGVYLNGYEWKPAITGGPTFSFSTFDSLPKPMDVSYGQIDFITNKLFTNLDWTKYAWSGSLATVWYGQLGDPFESYRQIWTGALGPFLRDNDQSAHVALLGPETALTRNLLSSTYQGTGGAEGMSDLLGALKPYAIGYCVNVAPVLIDPVYQIYQIDGYDPCPTNAVYSNALTLGPPKSTSATNYTELKNMVLDVTKGEWASAPNVGMFRLAADPGGAKLTADIGTATNVGAIVAKMISASGVGPSRIDTSVTNASGNSSFYGTEQITIRDAIRKAALEGQRYLVADGTGKFFLAPFVSNKPVTNLTSNRSTAPLIRPDTIVDEVAAEPVWRVSVGHTRVWSTHSTSEISPAIAQAAADLTAAAAAAKGAQDTANGAAALAATAITRLANMADDGILDRSDKRSVVQEFEGITAERAGLVSTASGLAITTEATAFTNAFNALQSYLTGLTPAYSDTTTDTPIVPATFKGRFTSYYLARQNLDNAIANAAATRANWTNVAARPTNLTELSLTDGTKLTGIATGATVGAPIGTNVGGVPAATIAGAAMNFNLRNDRDGSPILTPTFTDSGVSATFNSDGSANLSFSWAWTGANSDIDGFIVTVRRGKPGSGR